MWFRVSQSNLGGYRMRTVDRDSRGIIIHLPPAWVVAAGILAVGLVNVALIVAVAAGRFG
jgi:hypothetical protein